MNYNCEQSFNADFKYDSVFSLSEVIKLNKEDETTHFLHAHKNNLIRKPHGKIKLLLENPHPEVVTILGPTPGLSCKASNPLHHSPNPVTR